MTIRFCGDGSGWPPYTYHNPEDTSEILGYDLDVIREILRPHGIQAEFFLPSWRQCLQHAAKGQVFQVAVSASFSEERGKNFIYTRPYYDLTVSYFYSKARMGEKPVITSTADLFKQGLVCGRYSYNYEGSGVVRNDQISLIGKTYSALVGRTLSGDCAFFLGRPNVILGFNLIGQKILDLNEIGYAPLPGGKTDGFSLLVSKELPYAKELHRILDEGIEKMERNGRLEELKQKYYERMTQ